MRLKVITQYYTKPIMRKLQNQKFTYIIPVVFLTLFLSIIPLYLLEPRLETYYDAFVGGIASLFFFGYTNIKPITTLGVLIITMLTILGVIMHGVILNYFLKIIWSISFVKKIVNSLNKKWS